MDNTKSFEEMVADSREIQHLIPNTIENKKEYYSDLWDIVNSWSGRGDVIYSNKFFNEAQHLITNAIVLFEKGYFDCAFYSLRQSIEVSLTIAFLADNDDPSNQSEMLGKWKNKEKFPMQGQMIDKMKARNMAYADIKDKMTDFFTALDLIKHDLNKYVHKQGYDTFYGHRSSEERKKLKDDFTSFVEMSISAIAVHRLVIDPLPVLLMDESIYQKAGDMITEAFSEDFANNYLANYLDQFKETQMYKDYYNYFDAKETMLPSVLSLVKDQFFDREKLEEIQSQIHLLSLHDRLATCFFVISPKTAQIHFGSLGFLWYFSDVKTARISGGFNSQDLKIARDSNTPMNNKYEEAYLSFIKVHDDELYLEHNDVFDETEIELIQTMKIQFEEAITKANKDIEDFIATNTE